jgi:predicted RNA polymerase sigma factor
MVAALARTLGSEHLDVAEEVVQEALLRALQVWPHQGVPDNPEGWLYRVARNLAVDRGRRNTILAAKLHLLAAEIPEAGWLVEPALDDELALVFLCCHPALSEDSQVALVLKTAAHAAAPTFAATDWRGILDLYDQLLEVHPSPVVALNRAVALAEVEGPGAGLEALERAARIGRLESRQDS